MRKMTSLLLAAVIILVSSVSVFAETSISNAENYSLGTSAAGTIAETKEENAYQFTLSESGRINVSYTAENIELSSLKIYDEDGQQIWGKEPSWNSTSKQIAFNEDVELTGGTYYFVVSKYYGYGTYKFILSYTSANETFGEDQSYHNNSFGNADEIDTNQQYIGQIAQNDEVDNYSFTLSESGRINVSYTAENIERSSLKIYDESGQQIWEKEPSWNSTSKQIAFNEDVELTGGTYYFVVSKYYGYGTYKFKLSYAAANETFGEDQSHNNNSFGNADDIDVNQQYIGQIAQNDEVDNYSFTLSESGRINVSYTAENIERSSLKIYDENGQQIWEKEPSWNSTSKQIAFNEDVELTGGTYYFVISKYYDYGTYKFKLSYTAANETFDESQSGSNNSFGTADIISLNKNYTGQIAINDEVDMYEFSLSSSGTVSVNYVAKNIERSSLKIYDENGQEIWSETPNWNSTSKQISYYEDTVLTAGTYYFVISKYYDYGTYQFLLSTSGKVETEPIVDEDDGTNDDDNDYDWDDDIYEPDVILDEPETETHVIELYIGFPNMSVDGKSCEIDPGRGTVPLIRNDRTLLPIRAVAEAFGAYVTWDETEEKVTIYTDHITIELWIGITTAYVNQEAVAIDVAPVVINDRTFMPLRFIAENLGLTVDWDEINQMVTIEGKI